MIKKKTDEEMIKTKNPNDIGEDNVEEIAGKAINTYFSHGMPVDAIFWGTVIKMLKKKYSKKLGEPKP